MYYFLVAYSLNGQIDFGLFFTDVCTQQINLYLIVLFLN